MNRRWFLQATAAMGTGCVTAGIQTGPLQAAGHGQIGTTPQEGPSTPHGAACFFQDADFNFVFLRMLGGAYYHVADVGACLAIAAQIQDGDAASAFQALTAAGDRLSASADAAAAAGRQVSARQAYLQAANYTFAATHFIDRMGAPDRFAPTWLRHQALWEQGAALLDHPMEHVRIPYEGTTLPGFLFKVDDSSKRRPLLIFNNGADGSLVDAWTQGAAPALERGYNCLTFYGPGQGTALLEQGLYFRPDWERVLTPVVDFALTRPEVKPQQLVVLGLSQGGYWVPRAVAFERRLAAAVADPGVWDVAAAWAANLPQPMLQLLAAGRKEQFDHSIQEGLQQSPVRAGRLAFRLRPFGLSSPYEAFKAAERYTLAGIAGRIRCPMLITDPEGEQFWPGQSQQLYDALSAPRTLVEFTATEGADLHCEVKAPGLRAQRIFDWLDATLEAT